MKNILRQFLCLSILFSVIAGGIPANATVTNNNAVATMAVADIESQVFQVINKVRTENNLPVLSLANDLTNVARFHSQDMAVKDYFDHVSPEGDNLQKRIERGGVRNWMRLAENIATSLGYSDPVDAAVRGWMKSQHHRDNILDQKLNQTGIGVAVDAKGRVYLTQLFATRKS
jgi:uncharacterized protein YkwD